MKAERRHELKTNTLATKIVQLPDVGKKWAGRAVLAVAILLAIGALIYNRVSNSRKAEVDAAEDVASARQTFEEIRNSGPAGAQPLDAAYLTMVKEKRKDALRFLDEAASLSTDAKLRGQGLLLKGDIDFALASIPSPFGSATQPALQMDPSRESLFSEAADAYKEVIEKYSTQPVNVTSARFGLAAIAENKSDWAAADDQYQAIIKSEDAPPTFKEAAKQRLAMLAQLKLPLLLQLKDSEKLVVKASATQSSTQPVLTTQPATLPSTLPAAITTKPSTRPS